MAAKHAQCPALQIGQPFNPFGLFVGIFIPDALVRTTGISAGAKLTYGRLARYAGQDGNCYPAVPTLASEIGMSARQTQNYLAELERSNLIRRTRRFAGRAQTSNAFQFLWHKLLEAGVKKTAPEGVQDPAPEGVKNPAPKESQIRVSLKGQTATQTAQPRIAQNAIRSRALRSLPNASNTPISGRCWPGTSCLDQTTKWSTPAIGR